MIYPDELAIERISAFGPNVCATLFQTGVGVSPGSANRCDGIVNLIGQFQN
ncbi:hypothetical protein [Chroococcidiopsis sp. SAG 2025]|uniref:hypothetical protein n=1 Tax=Chroococcidiopsis sp. SAG 2025 TaxID=171389 RepID=UPI0029373B83|nr:hypothetical protein [Chroococcidiopsis sp. SAG 2025]